MFTDIKLSANPNVTANATLVGHLKPTIEFGVSILGYTSGIYLDLDAHAELDLQLAGAADGSVSAGTDGSDATGTGTGGGCVDISTGLAVDVGADVDLVIFKIADNATLFSHTWDLYKTCFGDAVEKRDDDARSRRATISSGHGLVVFDGDQEKRHSGHTVSQAEGAVTRRRRSVPKRSVIDGLTCSTVLLGDLVSLVTAIVDAAR